MHPGATWPKFISYKNMHYAPQVQLGQKDALCTQVQPGQNVFPTRMCIMHLCATRPISYYKTKNTHYAPGCNQTKTYFSSEYTLCTQVHFVYFAHKSRFILIINNKTIIHNKKILVCDLNQ